MSAIWLFLMIVVDGVMPLVPGEAALLSQAPAAVAAGWPAVIGLGALAASAAFLGDVTAFLLGRRVGTTRFAWQKHRKIRSEERRVGKVCGDLVELSVCV